jgi:curved DNA-binding protein CbpA
MDKIRSLNNNPIEKLKYLKSLLQLPNINATQQTKIYQLIQQTEYIVIELQKKSHNINSVMPINRIDTQDSTSKGKQLIQQQQFNNIQSLTTNYKTEAERLEAEFELEQQRKRYEFKETQKRRHIEYQNKLLELQQNNVDALKIFNLSPNYKLEELKHSYKQLAIQTHPDRPNGNKEKFQLITKCYMSLLERLKNREGNSSFLDLRKDSNNYIKTQNTNTKIPTHISNLYSNNGNNKYLDARNQNFNTHLFNKLYEDNKLWDPNDDGYEKWFRNEKENETPPPDIFSTKFNISIFNTTFQNQKNKKTGTQIIQYTEPQELINTSVNYTMIDNSQPINDFSKNIDQPGSLNYSDLKLAYTGGCDLVNPLTVKTREEYKSIDELKKNRSDINYIMTPQEMAQQEILKRQKALQEMERTERIRNRDTLFERQYSNIHKKMLGYDATPDY